ncbi:MAG: glutamate-cysteine ligase family protein [Streptococcus sp.]|nr:glutamate-cysteine ligase family protein [Streptococcus sp.]
MSTSLEILKERYLKNIKKDPELYIGIELEFPIVNQNGGATDVEVSKALLKQLSESSAFIVERYDSDHYPIQLKSRATEDRILFEVSYNTLEFAFEKCRKIQEVEVRFNKYMETIQEFLRKHHHEIQGCGLHPFWYENDNSPVKYPRYEMLINYLSLSEKLNEEQLHHFPKYGSFICGNQVQLDVSRDNYLEVINVFNQIEAAKAYLFANSSLTIQDLDSKISRDIFWENSMHGILAENVGVNPHDFTTEEDFFDYLNKTAIFTAVRNGETLYFYPIAADSYLNHGEIKAYRLNGEQVILKPKEEDFQSHRSYQYQDLTTRGTVEFRSTCTQPLEKTFAPTAFHIGILMNLVKVKSYLKNCQFFKEEGRDYKKLRRKFSKTHLSKHENEEIKKFARNLLELAIEGLKLRKEGEEKYLQTI